MANPLGPAAGQNLFTPISHPVLRKPSHKNIRNFLCDRENYLLTVEDARNPGSLVQPISIVASVDRDLLQSLCDLGEFEGVDDAKDITNDVLEDWLEEQVTADFDSLILQTLEHDIRANVRMNLSEADPKLRVKTLFTDFVSFLRSKNWENLIQTNPELAIEQICPLLRPVELRDKIEADLELGKQDVKKAWKPFYQHGIRRAIACDEFISVRSAKLKMSEKASDDHKYKQKFNSSASTKSRDHVKSDKVDKSLPKCLNPEFPDSHLLKDCNKTSHELKQKLFEEYKKGKKKPLTSLKSTVLRDTVADGRYSGLLMDAVKAIINGDYGADHSALSETQLQDCAKANIYIPTLPLSCRMEVNLAIGGDKDEELTFRATKKARSSVTLDTPVGPFHLRNVELLVFKEHMSEVLLSRPLLKSMGFNLDTHLAKVREKFNDADFFHIGLTQGIPNVEQTPEEPSRLSRALIERITNPTSVTQEGLITGLKRDSNASSGIPSPTFYGDGVDDDPLRVDDEPTPGKDDTETTLNHIQACLRAATENGLPSNLLGKFEKLVHGHADTFRTELGSDPPASVPPMVIRLKQNAKPVRVKVRRYSPPQANFLRRKVNDLLNLGIVRRNNESEWACAPRVVPKPGPEKFRFTVDLRPVNNQTVPYNWPMPHLETAVHELANSTCYSTIDLCHGYWQMPLAEQSQECQSFITPDGVFTPDRVLHGQTNATFYFQSTINELCRPLRENILQWLDDLLIHAENPKVLLNKLASFFDICKKHGIKIHAAKCQLFLREVKWCGRTISAAGVGMDPRRLQGLCDMEVSANAAQLQQFVCAANWMRMAIPEFNKLVAPLKDLLEQALTKAGRRTRAAAAKITLFNIG